MHYESLHVPNIARLVARQLHEHTGLVPEIERSDNKTVVLILSSDRVLLTITYRRKNSLGYHQVHSLLKVDGEPRPLARSLSALVKIFADPDTQTANVAQIVGRSPSGERRLTHTIQQAESGRRN